MRGCVNDVEAMKDLLVERFRFDAADIVVLTDEPGSQVLPMGANVRRALGHMVDRTEPNDVLFFHFSGHETFVSAARPHNRHHHRDEAILPCNFNLITGVFSGEIDQDRWYGLGRFDKSRLRVVADSVWSLPSPTGLLWQTRLELVGFRHVSVVAVWMLDRGVGTVSRIGCLEVAQTVGAVRMVPD
ncbi:Metacaspase-9 [Platanthera guangdongensis]|uniref:Metacaspase-9 n=1 Tax=Platanthera guangdongensis TaxID=2320717 RepID=A0ABR2LJW1_9ASPA